MKRDILKRIEALEREDTERCVLWIGPPESGLAGWQVTPMNTGGDEQIWRDDDETDDALKARAAEVANRYRGVVVCFGMDAQGVTR